MKSILLLLMGCILLFVLTIITGKITFAHQYKIRSKTGIQRSEYITIGKIKQYIQIRGQDSSNPVILMLHGGPGNPMAYYSYDWQAELEQNYTVIHWDQRGCGNTFYQNKTAAKPTLDLLLSDLDELVDHIRLEFQKEKVILMGHSWGTFPGAIYAGQHPEKVLACISVSQMLDFKKSEQVSAQEAVHLAYAAGRPQDAYEIEKMLEPIMKCRKFDKPEAAKLLKFRQLKEKYLPSQYSSKMLILQLFSPYMTFRNLRWMFSFGSLIAANSALYETLLVDQKSTMYDYTLQYETPVIIIAGDCDWTTPYPMAVKYFNAISAPYKKFITIRNTGHIPFIDRKKEFSEALSDALCHVIHRL